MEDKKIDYNSMPSVMERLSYITNNINFSRGTKNISDLLGFLKDYYIEISADCYEDENKIWDDLEKAEVLIKSPSRTMGKKMKTLNEIDIRLRSLAKKHGFLTRTSEETKGGQW